MVSHVGDIFTDCDYIFCVFRSSISTARGHNDGLADLELDSFVYSFILKCHETESYQVAVS